MWFCNAAFISVCCIVFVSARVCVWHVHRAWTQHINNHKFHSNGLVSSCSLFGCFNAHNSNEYQFWIAQQCAKRCTYRTVSEPKYELNISCLFTIQNSLQFVTCVPKNIEFECIVWLHACCALTQHKRNASNREQHTEIHSPFQFVVHQRNRKVPALINLIAQ